MFARSRSSTLRTFVPEGTGIYVPPYVYNRDPRYFSPNPDSFFPERWLKAENDLAITHKTSAYLAFSAGPANCVGKPLALIVMRMALAALLQAFDMQFAEDYDSRMWMDGLGDWLVTTRGALPILLEQRSERSEA